MPHACGDISADVGIKARLFDLRAGKVVGVPGTVGTLRRGQPLKGSLGLLQGPTDAEGHGGFDVVPGVGVTTGEPGDHPVVELDGADRLDRLGHVQAERTTGLYRHGSAWRR